MADRTFSIEFFPPKTPEGMAKLRATRRQLAQLKPKFFSVTFGAGGSTRDRTLETVLEIQADGLAAAPHLSCVGSTRGSLREILETYRANGIRHIVALRGDVPGGEAYQPHPDGYAYAADLVAGLKRIADFEISVAAYPEVHPTAASPLADLDHLKRKLDAGATRAITNYFFDNPTFLRFLDLALAAGITAPIVPGIMPVSNYSQIVKFSQVSGVRVPDWLGRFFEGVEDDMETRRMIAAHVAAEQVRTLQANGIDEFHFYTLNRPDLTYAIAHILGVRPKLA